MRDLEKRAEILERNATKVKNGEEMLKRRKDLYNRIYEIDSEMLPDNSAAKRIRNAYYSAKKDVALKRNKQRRKITR